MNKIPWLQISIGCLIMMVLVVARSAVTVGKSFYYHVDWLNELVSDPWTLVGMAAAALGIGALVAYGVEYKRAQRALEEETEDDS